MTVRELINQKYLNILSFSAVIFIFLSLITIISTSSAQKFEFSIYDAFPWYFWLFLLSSFVLALTILLIYSFFSSEKKFLIFGVIFLFIDDMILLSLPIIRGYFFFGSGDGLTHVAFMKDIVDSSSIGISNMYPIDHLFGISINLLAGVPIATVVMIVPIIFSLFFILSFYVLIRFLYQKHESSILFLTFVSIPSFGVVNVLFAPNNQAVLLLPLFLYLTFKAIYIPKNPSFLGLLLIISILTVFFHPLVTIFIIIFLVLVTLTKFFFTVLLGKPMKIRNFMRVILLIIITFTIWSSYLYLLTKMTRPIINAITGSDEFKSEFQRYTNILSSANVDIITIVKQILNVYGQTIILGLLSFICLLLLIYFIKHRNLQLPYYVGFASIGFLVFFMISLGVFAASDIFGWGRIYKPAILFSLVFIPFCFGLLFTQLSGNKSKHLRSRHLVIIIGMSLIFLLYFSTFNLYMSPITRNPNQQVMASDYFGTKTFFEIRDDNLPVREYGLSHFRFYDAIYGRDRLRKNVVFSDAGLLPVDHFGYTGNSSISSSYSNRIYFLLNDQGRYFYTNIYPEFKRSWKFTPDDFEKLEGDRAVAKIYDNNNLDIFLFNQ